MPTLDAAGKPFGMMSADEYGFILESYDSTNADHIRLYRDVDYSVPYYSATPKVAAEATWRELRADLPPEFDKRTWIVIWNEPDKERADWLGETAYEISLLVLNDGYRVAFFGFSSGEPEYAHWSLPGMFKFLELATKNKDQIAVALHEYSFTTDHLLDDVPYYLVGRFQQLLDVCVEQGLTWPTIFITEFGWAYDDVPNVGSGMAQLKGAADLYAKYEAVKTASLWWLGGGFGGIANKLQKYIDPVTNAALSYVPPPPVPPPTGNSNGETRTLHEYLWDLSIARQPISLNPDALLQGEMLEDGRTPVESEEWETYPVDEIQYAYQAGEDAGGALERAVYAARVPDPGQPWVAFSFTDPYDDPPPGVLKLEKFPTDFQTYTQAFGVNKQNYDHFCDRNGVCLQGHNGVDIRAPLGTPFYAAVGGTVVHASDRNSSGGPSGYGWHVRVVTGDYTTIYAHATPDLRVSVGEEIVAGKILGLSGDTGNSFGAHLHFEMRRCPGIEGWPWCTIDPTPYLAPLLDTAPPTGIDMKPYFQTVNSGYGPFFVLQHNNGITENIQTQVDGTVFLNKGGSGQYEHLRVTASHIERREDTSHSASTFYTLDDGNGWSKWAPRIWKEGDSFFRNPLVTVYDWSCNKLSQDQVGSWLVFDKFWTVWTSPPSNASPQGITFDNVVEMSFRFAPDGEKKEIYRIAPNLGPYAEWWSSGGGNSWVSEIPQGRTPLSRNPAPCL